MSPAPPVAVIQFPGSNCEEETARALRAVGLEAWIHRWNEGEEKLRRAQAVVIPGGFSFQDRVRAGVLAAKLPLLSVVVELAGEGRPVLGICNGAQILVETGLLPGIEAERVELALAANRMRGRSGYYTRWVYLRVGEEAEACVFTKRLKAGDLIPIPMAHAEGRFAGPEVEASESMRGLTPLVYTTPDGDRALEFPWNPNGSLLSAAAVMNGRGNVMGMMPHPERALWLRQLPPSLRGDWGLKRRSRFAPSDPGPGWGIFASLAGALR